MIPITMLNYFVPGQVILHLECGDGIADLDLDKLGSDLANFLEAGDPWNRFIQSDTPAIIIRDSSGNAGIIFFLLELKEFHQWMDSDDVVSEKDELISLVSQMNALIDSSTPIIIYQTPLVMLSTASPNWLSSGAQHLPGTGGPGSWPVPAAAHAQNPVFNFQQLNVSDKVKSSLGEGINIAIFDTAPIKKEFDDPRWNSHPLVKELRNPDILKTKYCGFFELSNFQFFSPMAHGYEMPDHGLFIAGIIHTIAPKAKLTVYQVLNEYGEGTYWSMCGGLEKALHSHHPDDKLIFNLSLVLNVPIINIHLPSYLHVDPGFTDVYTRPEIIQAIHRMYASFERLMALLTGLHNIIVIAAAGNDTKPHQARPPARYPAAGASVIGVGALPKGDPPTNNQLFTSSSFSNLCDSPTTGGCMTLGGEPGVNNGVLGVYLHRFPVDSGSRNPLLPAAKPVLGHLRGINDFSIELSDIKYKNNNIGWAWWAGTSFSTAIISGLLAKAWNALTLNSLQDVQRFLTTAVNGAQTVDQERAVYVKQA